jgi:integrase
MADPQGQAVLLLGACCGLRREEIATLRWEDIDETSGRVRVRNSPWHTTKSGQQRSVHAPPALVPVLARFKGGWKSPFVFPEVYQSYRELPVEVQKKWFHRYQDGLRRGLGRAESRRIAWQVARGYQKPDRPIDPDRLTDLVPRLAKQAGLSHYTTHDLRRTFCTYLAACGTDMLAAQKLAGHSSPTVTAKSYVQPVLEMLNAQRQLPYWNVQAVQQLTHDQDVA